MSIINDFDAIHKNLKTLTGDHVWPDREDWANKPDRNIVVQDCGQQEKCHSPGMMPSGASPTQPLPCDPKPRKAIGS